MQFRFMNNQSEEVSVLCKPIGAKLWLSIISTLVNTTWGTASLVQDIMEHAEPTPTVFTWYQYYAYLEL